MLFAVDEFNGFFRKTSFKDAAQKWVGERCVVFRSLDLLNVVLPFYRGDLSLQNKLFAAVFETSQGPWRGRGKGASAPPPLPAIFWKF